MLNTDDDIVWTELSELKCLKLKLNLQFTAMLLRTDGVMLDSLLMQTVKLYSYP